LLFLGFGLFGFLGVVVGCGVWFWLVCLRHARWGFGETNANTATAKHTTSAQHTGSLTRLRHRRRRGGVDGRHVAGRQSGDAVPDRLKVVEHGHAFFGLGLGLLLGLGVVIGLLGWVWGLNVVQAVAEVRISIFQTCVEATCVLTRAAGRRRRL
jgi:hypothetical protein